MGPLAPTSVRRPSDSQAPSGTRDGAATRPQSGVGGSALAVCARQTCVVTALDDAEIEPGLVAWLDQPALNSDEAVLKSTPHLGDPEPRPFVCFARNGDSSSWAPVTTIARSERLHLPANWRSGGGPGWVCRDQYLVDGANTYSGPSVRFVAASTQDYSTKANRMRLSADGVEAVLAEVERQKHRRRPGT